MAVLTLFHFQLLALKLINMDITDVNKNGVEKKIMLYVQNLYVDNMLNTNPVNDTTLVLNPADNTAPNGALSIYNQNGILGNVIQLYGLPLGNAGNNIYSTLGPSNFGTYIDFNIVANAGTISTSDQLSLAANTNAGLILYGQTGTNTIASYQVAGVNVFQIYGSGGVSILNGGDYDINSAAPATSTNTTSQSAGAYAFINNYWNGTASTDYNIKWAGVIDTDTPTGHVSWTAQGTAFMNVYDSGIINLLGTNAALQLNGTSIFDSANTWSKVQTATGFATTAGAATTITAGASPYAYTNSSASNQEIFITGGSITAITFSSDGGTAISLNITLSQIVLRPNDVLTITYTTAPTLNSIQL